MRQVMEATDRTKRQSQICKKKQLEAHVDAIRSAFGQIRGEADEARKVREKLDRRGRLLLRQQMQFVAG